MSGFAQQQADFQRAILEGDAGVLAEILDSTKERRDVLFSVYRHAYGARLVEVMRNENPLLHAYLGDDGFDEMARAYIAARPSRHPNLRWFCQGLPEFLAATEPYRDYRAVGEVSGIETALSDAFDAPDGAVLTLTDFGEVAPDSFKDLVFQPHPSARRLDLKTNAFAIWDALKEETTPPEVETPAEPERLIVWREDLTAMIRPMSAEEAMMWDEACSAVPFGVLCEMAATYDDPDNAAGRAAGYLQGWVSTGMLGGFTIGG
ncbi:HvfC/BufC N-terminal domain-containing protein [Methylobacterium haplocladii]|uniref:DUF2063 domain-containing protein n=1 Tax=Methylobacterium haplocladii TaxID=1176176 RepID=A0A512ISN0_9HYPH|nr:DNA-binding domain-containing protein [Methylobacterium haplocladii]GEP00693.1 DUF2063 domain-containing protein [Methylobacterium haplocladii]GJD82386.1 hypothetical protein HPGCJGGD_0240 [Methylobacterium haplocladii]GLS60784.1 DUF2063 domain-containing protein [Methylobacterium haplocladii]